TETTNALKAIFYKAVTTQNIAVTDSVANGSHAQVATVAITPSDAGVNKLSLSAASSTPHAGATEQLHITAVDAYGNTAAGYTGSKNLTFSGASNSPNNDIATVTNNAGTPAPIIFGSTTTVTFASGVATESGTLLMKLYKAVTTQNI